MSIGPTGGGIVGSSAGAPLSQTKGGEVERNQQDNVGQQRQIDSDQKADNAAGIDQISEDQETSDRDADGRRVWEIGPDEDSSEEKKSGPTAEPRSSKDTHGKSGNSLDLTG